MSAMMSKIFMAGYARVRDAVRSAGAAEKKVRGVDCLHCGMDRAVTIGDVSGRKLLSLRVLAAMLRR
jgi:galactitol-specific phosphotransferase system IIC component